MHVYFQKIFFVAAISFFAFGCTRSNEGSTKLTIQMPTAASLALYKTNQSSKISEIISYSNDVSAYQEWSGVNPTSLADFNCFMVAAAGPETFLNRNSCGKKIMNATSADPFVPYVSFGPVKGAIPQGTSLEFEVASGNNRVIYLIGFKALNTAACADYKSTAFDQSNLSKPYIIGKSSPVNLTGAEATVSVPMTFDANNWFDECSGPEFDHVDDNRMATQIMLNKTSYPMYTTIFESCQSIDVELHDSSGRPAKSATDVNIKLETIRTAGGLDEPVTTLFTNDNYHDCDQNIAGPSSFTITAGNISTKRWFKAPGSSYTSTKYRVNAGSSLPEQSSDFGMMTLGNLSDSAQQIDLTGPTNVVLNNCYRYTANDRTMGRGYTNGVGQHVSIKMPSFATAYNSASSCAGETGAITSTISGDTRTVDLVMTNTGSQNRFFYVKYKSPSTVINKSFQFSATSPGYVESRMNVYVSGSLSTTISNLAIREDTAIPNVYMNCYGPFHLALTNESKSDIVTPAARSINVDLSAVPFSDIKFLNDTCSGGQITGMITVPAFSSSAIFYIQIIGASLLSGEQTAKFTDNTSGAVYTFKFYPN